MSKEQTDLLACPFCGSAPQWEENDAVDARSWGPEYRIACRNAACFGPVTSNYGNRPDAIAAWNRRASLSPAGGVQGVRVKALEWSGPGRRYAYKSAFFMNWTAASVLGTMTVRYKEHNPDAPPGYGTPPYDPHYEVGDRTGKFNTLDEAKAAAQADYEKRILSALSSQAQTTGGVDGRS